MSAPAVKCIYCAQTWAAPCVPFPVSGASLPVHHVCGYAAGDAGSMYHDGYVCRMYPCPKFVEV